MEAQNNVFSQTR